MMMKNAICHNEMVMNLTNQLARMQARLDKMYDDRLEDIISAETFQEKNAQYRIEKEEILSKIKAYHNADNNYVDFGITILELKNMAPLLYSKQSPHEKAKFLKILLSNSKYRDGALTPEWRKPFDILACVNERSRGDKGETDAETLVKIKWLQR